MSMVESNQTEIALRIVGGCSADCCRDGSFLKVIQTLAILLESIAKMCNTAWQKKYCKYLGNSQLKTHYWNTTICNKLPETDVIQS